MTVLLQIILQLLKLRENFMFYWSCAIITLVFANYFENRKLEILKFQTNLKLKLVIEPSPTEFILNKLLVMFQISIV